MKLSNRTILIIGNEVPFKLNLIKHLLKSNNKVIVMSHHAALHDYITKLFPQVIKINLNLYNDTDRTRISDELNSQFLSPSCIIYNEHSFTDLIQSFNTEHQHQETIESFFTSITHLDEILLPFLETEADATVTYILPQISVFHFTRRKIFYILKKTIEDYIAIMNGNYANLRYVLIQFPLKQHMSYIRCTSTINKETRLDRQTKKLIRKLENYNYPF